MISSPPPLAPLADPEYLPHILELVFTYLSDPSLATCLRVSRSFHALAAPLLYRHLTFGEVQDPFKGLDVYNPETRERQKPPSTTKMDLLGHTLSIEIRAHPDEMCKRYRASGWRMPKFAVMRLRRPLPRITSPQPPRRWVAQGGHVVAVEATAQENPPPQHPRACKILTDTYPSTLVVFDMGNPNSSTNHVLGVESLPATIQKLVLVLDGAQSSHWSGVDIDAIFRLVPIETKHIVCVFRPLDWGAPGTISRLVNAMVEMILFDEEKRYTIVNIAALELREMEGMNADEKLERFMTPMEKCLDFYLKKRERVDEVLQKITYMTLGDYLRDAGDEFQLEDVKALRPRTLSL